MSAAGLGQTEGGGQVGQHDSWLRSQVDSGRVDWQCGRWMTGQAGSGQTAETDRLKL